MEDRDFGALLARLSREKPFLAPAVALRLARAYGSRVWRLLGSANSMAELGPDHGGGLTQTELVYLAREEWARTAEDVLWRRSKLGLHLTQAQQEAVAAAIESLAPS